MIGTDWGKPQARGELKTLKSLNQRTFQNILKKIGILKFLLVNSIILFWSVLHNFNSVIAILVFALLLILCSESSLIKHLSSSCLLDSILFTNILSNVYCTTQAQCTLLCPSYPYCTLGCQGLHHNAAPLSLSLSLPTLSLSLWRIKSAIYSGHCIISSNILC